MRNVIGKICECAVLNQQELADLHMMFHTLNPELSVEDLKEIYR